MPPRPRKKTKSSPPILSQEFFIENHADIFSVVCIVIVVGLVFQVTHSLCSPFIALQHNVTQFDNETGNIVSIAYKYGPKDICTVIFFSMMAVIFRAIEQEYLIDKYSKKLRLSKAKQSKMVESCNLFIFYIISLVWGSDLISRETWPQTDGIIGLHKDYPHTEMSFPMKLFFVVQLAFWLHNVYELYLLKVKREEIIPKLQLYFVNFAFILAAYLLNLNRLAFICILLHYLVQVIFHASRLLLYTGKKNAGLKGMLIWDYLFPVARINTAAVSVWMFIFVLPLEESAAENVEVDGNFNRASIRYLAVGSVVLLQIYMLIQYRSVLKRYYKEQNELNAVSTTHKTKSQRKKKDSKKESDTMEEKEDENSSSKHDSGHNKID